MPQINQRLPCVVTVRLVLFSTYTHAWFTCADCYMLLYWCRMGRLPLRPVPTPLALALPPRRVLPWVNKFVWVPSGVCGSTRPHPWRRSLKSLRRTRRSAVLARTTSSRWLWPLKMVCQCESRLWVCEDFHVAGLENRTWFMHETLPWSANLDFGKQINFTNDFIVTWFSYLWTLPHNNKHEPN